MVGPEIDAELLAEYRWRHICTFPFALNTRMNGAVIRVRAFLRHVARRERLSAAWIALFRRDPWHGPYALVLVAGVRRPFLHHVREYNIRSGGCCYVLHSNLTIFSLSGPAYSPEV
jgi:hypothetical protein